ncbi:hypothetical protein BJ165DRAFT_1522113 [Panaeolus papilionaceus]|nr:hypothetical protein BJ165DRAFT_1522113 [Panaeolus papilionaceus]
MSNVIACVTGCPRTFHDASHLTKHKSTCPIAVALQEKIALERKARGLRSLLPKANFRAQQSWKMRLQTQIAKQDSCSNSIPVASSSAMTLAQDLPSSASRTDMDIDMPNDSASFCNHDVPDTSPPPPPPPPPPSIPQTEPPPQLSRSGRPRREVRLPCRFRDYLPESATSFLEADEPGPIRRVLLIVRDRLVTSLNSFGVWRDYPNKPSADPDSLLSPADLANHTKSSTRITTGTSPDFWPFKNSTIHSVMKWLNNGHVAKSESEVTKFVRDVILSPTFRIDDLVGFDAHQENQRLDGEISQSELHSQFTERSVDITIPSGQPNNEPVVLSVPGLLHRSILAVIKEAFTGPLSHLLHYSPFKLFHKNPDTGRDERIFGEVYTSDAFLAESDKVRYKSPCDPDDPTCSREKVVAALMFSSDATHLTNFGNSKAWPIYFMLGNLSKYIRALPNGGGMHHLAYIPSLPESFKAYVQSFHPKWKSQKAQILTHCRRELMQAVWNVLLDDEFIHAYKYGIVIKCINGIERRIFPRLFTYSADYPEKVLLATIRDKGMCPCPRCLVQSEELDQLGTREDTEKRGERRMYQVNKVKKARVFIYKKAKPINGVDMEALLKKFSGVPTTNAFVDRLGPDFDPSKMLVVDMLHEFELGVWRTVFSHLIRLLYAAVSGSDTQVNELDRRFAVISTFGHGTIRNFAANSSEMKKMAARDFEDLLQCSIPVFEGLLDEPHNQRLMKLLYCMAEWHALAKLRMHTNRTIALLQELTTELGKQLRHFRDTTCVDFQTFELPKEALARARREAASSTGQHSATSGQSSGRQAKTLNLQTVKMHFLGDYATYIRLFGTTDSYSTQLAELQHRIIKQYYAMTNKKEAMVQVGKKQSRKQVFQADEHQEEQDLDAKAKLEERYSISESPNMPIAIFELVGNNTTPSVKDFIPKLQEHILYRLTSRSEGFTQQDRDSVRIRNNTIYEHVTARINYTTYDQRRDYNVINSHSRPYIMAVAPESEPHPSFWYAAVLGIFHVDFQHIGSTSKNLSPQKLHFLWVRWLEPVEGYDCGRTQAALPKLRFMPGDDEFAYGCLDPALVLRGCHIIPAFHDGPRAQPVSQKVQYRGRHLMREESLDHWKNYYAGIFVDRDMFMRYLGLGIGHKTDSRPKSPQEGSTDSQNESLEVETARDIEDSSAHDMEIDEAEPTSQGPLNLDEDDGDKEYSEKGADSDDDEDQPESEEDTEITSDESASDSESDTDSDISYDDL